MSMYTWLVKKGGYNNFGNYKKAVGDVKGLLFFVAGISLLVFAYWLWNSAIKSDSNSQDSNPADCSVVGDTSRAGSGLWLG